MKLHYLLQSLTTAKLPACDISALSNDSRRLSAGCLFLAEQGIASHALDYLTDEQVKQVAAIAYQPPYDLSRFAQSQSDKWIAVEGLNTHISAIAKTFYAPHFSAPLIGVTGTNGKTSVTHFIAQLADYGVIGTMGYGNIEQLQALSHTTPDALAVQRILAELSTQFSGVAMEVSSHALALHRVNAVDFTVAVFMNLSQDHLDFHDDMADYYAAKSRLFAFDSVKAAVINTDDDAGYALAQQLQKTGKRVLAFGKDDRVQAFAEFAQITRVSLSHAGIQADIHYQLAEKTGAEKTDNRQLCAPVWGEFNVANVLAALLALFAGGYPVNDLLARARYLHGVKGRIEAIDLGENKTAIIDYSHTPDALDNVLATLRGQCDGRLFAVFGCGGDRDSRKRPLMAEAVNRGADFAIVTDDNPRTEQSADIIADILSGEIDRRRFTAVSSRRDAIRYGLSLLADGDTLLIAGKGHEDYQIIGTEKQHFSDHEVVRQWLAEERHAAL